MVAIKLLLPKIVEACCINVFVCFYSHLTKSALVEIEIVSGKMRQASEIGKQDLQWNVKEATGRGHFVEVVLFKSRTQKGSSDA